MTGFSLKCSDTEPTVNLELRFSEEPVTWRMLINLLRDLADQLEEDHKDEGQEIWQ
jgi:hypothetical protein